MGSLGAFLVIEEKSHATARGAKPLARMTAVLSEHGRRNPGAATATLQRLWADFAPRLDSKVLAVISGASGVDPPTSEERAFLSGRGGVAVRETGSHLGHGVEGQFTMNIALAAITLGHGRLFPSFDPTGFERDMDSPVRQIVVTGIGHWRGEGLALIEAVG